MGIKVKSGKIALAALIIFVVALSMSACKSSQYGCPNQITKAEQQSEVRS